MSKLYVHRVLPIVVVVCFFSFLSLPMAFAQETPVETPTATPVSETPSETPTATPTLVPTDTPVPPTPTTPPVSETPTATPVAETPTNTPVPPAPTATPTPTESAVAVPSLSLSVSDADLNLNEEVVVSIEIADAADVDAFSLDVLQSVELLSFVELTTAGTLTEEFINVSTTDIASGVRIAGVGGPAAVDGAGTLIQLRFVADTGTVGTSELSFANLLDDLTGATISPVSITVSESPVATPTNTPVPPTPTNTPETPVATPTNTPETPVATPTPTATLPPGVTPTNTPILVEPSPTPTAVLVSTDIGITHYSSLGFTFNGGAANLVFDIGLSDGAGNLFNTRIRDGFPDPAALSPVLFLDIFDDNPFDGIGGDFVPVGRDLEFTGAIAEDSRTEGAYFLLGGTLGIFPPVNARLGAMGNEQGGGIDFDGDGVYTRNFGFYESDIIPVSFFPELDMYVAPLVDIEPAGNDGFYALTDAGVVLAEGDSLESIETESRELDLGDASAVALKIFRGADVDASNSQYSSDLIGTGAYVLASDGQIFVLGDAPALETADAPVIPQGPEPFGFKDIELIPNPAGTEFIGVGVLNGDGIVTFVPFASTTVTAEITAFVNALVPFNNLQTGGFPFDIARDFEVEINDNPIFGLDADGNSVPTSGRRVGTFMTDGYGGTFVGGASTRFAAVPAPNGTRDVNGEPSVIFPANDVYLFPDDVIIDIELSSAPGQ